MSRHIDPDQELEALLTFGAGSRVSTGFGYLDLEGNVDDSRGCQLWITCRMTHIFALAALRAWPQGRSLATHGVFALTNYLRDGHNGGWFSQIRTELDANGRVQVLSDRKEAYAHAFVVLAASSAVIAGIEGANRLLDTALNDQENHWWEPEFNRVKESWDASYRQAESYRGANANMHTVEAYLAAWDATGQEVWLERAGLIVGELIGVQARQAQWRVPEHYREDWSRDDQYNHESVADPFRPFGITPGHGLEWARLVLQVWVAFHGRGDPPGMKIQDLPAWAWNLTKRAWADAWQDTGGLVYTTDFAGNPVVPQRMHWVLCEAFATMNTIAKVRGVYDTQTLQLAERYSQLLQEFIGRYLIETPGRWHHELDELNNPVTQTWSGRPDIYHAVQALLISKLPIGLSFAKALAQHNPET